jgi:DNA replication protein DnaC
MERYVRLNKTVEGKGDLIPLSDLKDQSKLNGVLCKHPDADWYTSVYSYEKEVKEYFGNNGNSIKGFKGKAFSSRLLFDLDSSNVVEARDDAIELLHRLNRDLPQVQDYTKIFFSGGKGFHVEVFLDKEFTPEELKTVCSNIATGLKTFDKKIYNTTRLIRLKDTKHQTTGKYKIELEPNDLIELSVDEIKEKASRKSTINFKPKNIQTFAWLDKYMTTVYPTKSKAAKGKADESGIKGISEIDFTKCPKHMPRCIYALTKGIMVSGAGERNEIFLRLAAYYKNQGFSKDVTYNLLKGVARENFRLYPEHEGYKKEEIWNTVISSVFDKNNVWKTVPGATGSSAENETLHKYCEAVDKHTNKRCVLHSKTDNQQSTMRIDEVFDSFNKFAKNFDKNIVKTGIDFIDDNMKLATGTTSLIVGAAGSGKTTLTLNIMENANALKQHTMFFSLDMHKNLIYLKLAQKLTNYTQDEILDFHKKQDTDKILKIKKLISEKYAMTYFDFSGTLTLEQMRDKVIDQEDKTGNKIKLVVVDYAGRITSQFSETYANARHNALKSKEVADVTDAAWIILSQISRNVGDGCSPLRTKRAAKESGDWEESASNVITVWRPFMGNPENDDVMRMYLAKNRMGKELESPLYWNGEKGIVRDMTEEDLAVYLEMRESDEKEYLKSKNNRI